MFLQSHVLSSVLQGYEKKIILSLSMNVTELLAHGTIESIVKNYQQTGIKKNEVAYNLFSVSSYTSHLENFHSDVIASLLDPKGLHKEGNRFLSLFINYLQSSYALPLDVNDYSHANVLREKGRIDIWIKNNNSTKAILIENKINNAGDRENQLDDYYVYSENKQNCQVEAIIYLSLDGLKKAPVTVAANTKLIKNIGAYTNRSTDLVSGWLQPCLDACTTHDSFSFIYQYKKLILHLASKQMDNTTIESFYKFINEHNAFDTVNDLLALKDRLPEHRTNHFIESIKDISPFVNPFRWKYNYMIYDNYKEGENSFKLDIHFMESGNASILIWNPTNNNEIGLKALTEKLLAVKLFDQFEIYDQFKYAKFFRLSDEYKTLQQIDDAIIKFTNDLLEKLRAITK